MALAVSGGGDSMGLLAAAARDIPGRFTVLTVDHAMREGSAADAAHVVATCEERGFPCEVLTVRWDGDSAPASNRAARARDARYGLMAEACARLGAEALLTAHHADDQAETLLMRLARGSGSKGLAGIRQRSEIAGLTVLRPYLAERSERLRETARTAGFTWREDPSNNDLTQDRPRVRALLRESGAFEADALAVSAAHLADSEEVLAWVTTETLRSRVVRTEGAFVFDHEGLPPELKRRVLAHLLPESRGGDVAALASKLQSNEAATLGGYRFAPGPTWRGSAEMRRPGAQSPHGLGS